MRKVFKRIKIFAKLRKISKFLKQIKMDEKLSSDESVMKKLKNKKNYTSGYLGNKTTPASSSFIPLLISFLYSSLMIFLNSFIVVVIHDRTPNKDKHPPLPDVLLDNISFRSWSFKASEATVIAFVVAFATLLAFHRHRCGSLCCSSFYLCCLFELFCVSVF